jgi:hypothetical protein
MSARSIAICLLSVFIGASTEARAQETIDVAKITCDQFLSGRVADSRSITLWLSGYYSGTRKNTLVDVSELQNESREILDYCITHPSAILMNVVETLFANKK